MNRETETALAVDVLLAGLGAAALVDKSNSLSRARALKIALDYIDARKEEVFSIGEMCTAAKLPWRTLTRAFHERFGVGPKAYLNQLRLSNVRTRLLTAEEPQLIADIANEYNFWHMGQFAHDYQELFGELPSETFQRSVAGREKRPAPVGRKSRLRT